MKHTRLYRALGLILGLALVAASCAAPPAVLVSEPDFTGLITTVSPIGGDGTLGQILVESLASE